MQSKIIAISLMSLCLYTKIHTMRDHYEDLIYYTNSRVRTTSRVPQRSYSDPTAAAASYGQPLITQRTQRSTSDPAPQTINSKFALILLQANSKQLQRWNIEDVLNLSAKEYSDKYKQPKPTLHTMTTFITTQIELCEYMFRKCNPTASEQENYKTMIQNYTTQLGLLEALDIHQKQDTVSTA